MVYSQMGEMQKARVGERMKERKREEGRKGSGIPLSGPGPGPKCTTKRSHFATDLAQEVYWRRGRAIGYVRVRTRERYKQTEWETERMNKILIF